ncbi:MAG: ABC transporter permease [Clostridia bacterium]|nr:ABC transporter permease [Clostridia bacterium]
MAFNLVPIIHRAIMVGTPLLFGSTGEILTEKSGHLNLGTPGIMYIGAITGVMGAFFYQQAVGVAHLNPVLILIIPMLSCLLGSLLASLLYCFLTVTLHANQNVTGLALTTFGVGFGNFFGGSLVRIVNKGQAMTSTSIALTKFAKVYKTTLPFADKLGWFGELFLNYGFLVYLAIVAAVVVSIFLKRTRSGLYLRAVGENPATADAAGINVTKYRYLSTCIGGMIAGLGGLYYIMDYTNGVWSNDGFGDRGWLAIALVIFAVWKPLRGIIGSYLFGALYILFAYVHVSMEFQPLLQMLPYVVTIIVLIITSIQDKREAQPPAGLGLNYYREDR